MGLLTPDHIREYKLTVGIYCDEEHYMLMDSFGRITASWNKSTQVKKVMREAKQELTGRFGCWWNLSEQLVINL